MKKPTKAVLQFLENHRITVLGVSQTDGTVHSATLHYSYSKIPFAFYFLTTKKSRKSQSLLNGKESNASLVIGFSEEEFVTFQAKGEAKIVDTDYAWNTYSKKYIGKEKQRGKDTLALIEFVPTWWRYTDLKTTPWLKFSSE